MGDVGDQTAAKEMIGILRDRGFSELVNLLEAGTPLTPWRISKDLKISRAAAAKMIQEARDVATREGGTDLPALSDNPAPARTRKRNAATKKKKSTKRPVTKAASSKPSPAPVDSNPIPTQPTLSSVCSIWREAFPQARDAGRKLASAAVLSILLFQNISKRISSLGSSSARQKTAI